jgi:hypothetical protein
LGEASSKLRALVKRGLLREIQSPREPTVVMTVDGPRETESPFPLCLGGPYFLCEDVLAIRRDAVEARATSTEEVVGELLRFILDTSR